MTDHNIVNVFLDLRIIIQYANTAANNAISTIEQRIDKAMVREIEEGLVPGRPLGIASNRGKTEEYKLAKTWGPSASAKLYLNGSQ